jgi:3',5'-nucleoside bisphosphate phosphatase
VIDLHTHTVRSDGTTTPTENVRLAAHAHLSGIAITDHDTLAGWDEAADACAQAGITFVPGIELSCEASGRGVHLLGYWVDPDHEPLRRECARMRTERDRRVDEMLDRLRALGVEIDADAVRARANGAPAGRPHVAAVMVEAGIVPDVQAAFDGYLRDGGPAYVEKRALDPAAGVELLRAAGGVAVLAHPGLSGRDGGPVTAALLDRLVAAGLAGIEAEHAGHDEAMISLWTDLARIHGLEVTGSSDFHGMRKELCIGDRATPRMVVERLRAHCVEARAS